MKQLTVDELYKRLSKDYARGICEMLITILDINDMVIVDKNEFYASLVMEDDLK